MANFSFKGLTPGKKYRMVIEANTVDGLVQVPRSIEFTTPEACSHASNYSLQVKKSTFQVKNDAGKMVTKTRLYFKIPKDIMSNIVWKDDVRDVVWIVYRVADTKDDLTSDRKYLVGNGTVSFTVPTMDDTAFNAAPWTDGHPAVFSKNINPTKYFTFQFVVARYVKTESTWNGYWLHKGNKLEKILSKQVVFNG